MFTNIRSIRNKLIEFHSMVAIRNPDIICLVETWLSPEIKNNIFKLPKYTIFRRDRKTKGGGILLALKAPWIGTLIENYGDEEMITVDLQYKNKKLLRVIGIYNPSFNNITYMKKLFSALHSILLNESNILLMGDFNLPIFTQTFTQESTKQQYKLFKSFLNKLESI